jgi:preprotein translocase SecE subunit
MDTSLRYLNVAYLALGLIFAWLGAKSSELLFAFGGPRADRILFGDVQLSAIVGVAAGLALTLYCWRTPKIYNWATEVTTELSAVTWPKKDETQRSTHVVIMFSIAISICLAAFDFFWKFVTDLIL